MCQFLFPGRNIQIDALYLMVECSRGPYERLCRQLRASALMKPTKPIIIIKRTPDYLQILNYTTPHSQLDSLNTIHYSLFTFITTLHHHFTHYFTSPPLFVYYLHNMIYILTIYATKSRAFLYFLKKLQ